MKDVSGSFYSGSSGSFSLDGGRRRISQGTRSIVFDAPCIRNLFPRKDYYKVLEVDYDATDETIRLNYRRLALKWHPDKHKGNSSVTAKFQEINEAYKVLSDPAKRLEYDTSGTYEINRYTLREYLTRFKGMILTCNGLGISHSPFWTQQLMESESIDQ